MIKIELAKEIDAEVLAKLGRQTYVESHGHFIKDKNDLKEYTNAAFSISKTRDDLNDSNNLIFILYSSFKPVGYVKLVLHSKHQSVDSENICQLERIYILSEFIPLKVGQRLLDFIEAKAKEQKMNAIWLSVYIKNNRAIRFYQKNEFKNVGALNFLVNGTEYENIVFSKKL